MIASKPPSFDASGNAGFVNNIAKQPQWGTCPVAYATRTYLACKTTSTMYLASSIASIPTSEGDIRCRVAAGSNYFWATYEDIDCSVPGNTTTKNNNNQLIWNYATTHGVPNCSAQWDASQTLYQLYSTPMSGYILSNHYIVTKL